MFSSLNYILFEFIFICLSISVFIIYPKILKFRHIFLILSLLYILYISSQTNVPSIFAVFQFPDLFSTIFYCLIPTIIISLSIIIIHKFKPDYIVDSTKVINHPKLPKITPLILYPLLSVPLQEIIFRWFYINRLQNPSFSLIFIIIFSSLVFAIVHLPFGKIPLFIGTFLLGIWWGTLYITTGNIWYPIISHAILGNILIWLAIYPDALSQ